MSAALLLLGYALLASMFGHRVLRGASLLDRAPRLGVLAWQALTYSIVFATVLGGLALWLPAWPGAASLAHFLDACVTMLRQQYATPGGAITSTAGAALSIATVVRIGYAFTRKTVRITRGRAAQRRQLTVLADRAASGILVVDHDLAAAYCLPGRHKAVVVTSAALACLDEDQLAAVLAHERAHLRGRHDLVLASTAALADAFWFLPAFPAAAAEVARLVELRADDIAARTSDRLTLATALVRLAEGAAPAGALGAGGATAIGRVRRMTRPAEPLGMLSSAALLIGAAVVVATPFLVAAAPAIAAAASDYCPVPTL